jgi:hypothetical protein
MISPFLDFRRAQVLCVGDRWPRPSTSLLLLFSPAFLPPSTKCESNAFFMPRSYVSVAPFFNILLFKGVWQAYTLTTYQ